MGTTSAGCAALANHGPARGRSGAFHWGTAESQRPRVCASKVSREDHVILGIVAIFIARKYPCREDEPMMGAGATPLSMLSPIRGRWQATAGTATPRLRSAEAWRPWPTTEKPVRGGMDPEDERPDSPAEEPPLPVRADARSACPAPN
eukprot:scaffold2671_cov252-Pinguiococcus_pyrenoidosus.AAC.12